MCHICYMNNWTQKLKLYYNKFRGLFPSALPTGMTEFKEWADSLIETYPLPTSDRDSLVFGLAAMIMRLGPLEAYKSKYWFVLSLRAAISKQIAGANFQEIKIRQQKQMAEDAAKQAEAANVTKLTSV